MNTISIVLLLLISIDVYGGCPPRPQTCREDEIRAHRKSDGCEICAGWGSWPELIYPIKIGRDEIAISDAGLEGYNSILACNIYTRELKFWGTMPVCIQDGKCRFERGGASTKSSTDTLHSECPAPVSQDCKNQSWQDCVMSAQLIPALDKKCFTNSPTKQKLSGCDKKADGAQSDTPVQQRPAEAVR